MDVQSDLVADESVIKVKCQMSNVKCQMSMQMASGIKAQSYQINHITSPGLVLFEWRWMYKYSGSVFGRDATEIRRQNREKIKKEIRCISLSLVLPRRFKQLGMILKRIANGNGQIIYQMT